MRGESCVCGSRPCVFSLRKTRNSFSALDPISMTWRLAGNQEAHCACAPVDGLVRVAGCDLDSVSLEQAEDLMLDLQSQLTFQHEKELSCTLVMVPDLACAGRHPLFDDIQIRRADKEPAITASSPGVMLSAIARDDFGRHFSSM
jgi:hypothetical protein